jgi:hypothetical protein
MDIDSINGCGRSGDNKPENRNCGDDRFSHGFTPE